MPLDNNMTIPKEEGKTYPPLPKNVYQVELLDIKAEDKPKYKNPNEKETMLSFQFTLLSGRDESQEKEENKNLRGRNVWKNYVQPSLYIGKNGKNALYQIVEAINKREVTREEEATGLSGAYLNALIGKQLKVFIDHREKDGNIYDNITSFIPAETEMTPLTAEEKEKAMVKPKTDENQSADEQGTEEITEIKVDDIPFGN